MMKKIICGMLSVILVLGIFGFSVSANGNEVYEFVVDGTEYTVSFEGDTIPAEFRAAVAQKMVGADTDGAQTYGLLCDLWGHEGVVSTSSVTVHKVNPYHPRCRYEVWDVTVCKRCGELMGEELVSFQYRICCDEE